jgi:hypothetical protein
MGLIVQKRLTERLGLFQAITVATSATWNYVTVHKKRIWAVEKYHEYWYLPVRESLQAQQQYFPSVRCSKREARCSYSAPGLSTVAQVIDDLFVIVHLKGEIAVYQGTDPASSTTWALIGVYDVAEAGGR